MNLRNFFRSLTAVATGAACFIMLTSLLMMTEAKAQGAAPTPPSTNPIPAENAKTGTLDWRIQPLRRSTAAGRETEGYASHTSVNASASR